MVNIVRRCVQLGLVVATICVVAQAQEINRPSTPKTGASSGSQIKIVLLGTGTPRPMIERFGMSTLVQAGDETLLFDAGRGCAIRLAQAGVPLKDVTKLFLTHLHSDHTVGIPDLWLTGWIFD